MTDGSASCFVIFCECSLGDLGPQSRLKSVVKQCWSGVTCPSNTRHLLLELRARRYMCTASNYSNMGISSRCATATADATMALTYKHRLKGGFRAETSGLGPGDVCSRRLEDVFFGWLGHGDGGRWPPSHPYPTEAGLASGEDASFVRGDDAVRLNPE